MTTRLMRMIMLNEYYRLTIFYSKTWSFRHSLKVMIIFYPMIYVFCISFLHYVQGICFYVPGLRFTFDDYSDALSLRKLLDTFINDNCINTLNRNNLPKSKMHTLSCTSAKGKRNLLPSSSCSLPTHLLS
jgi:hypothetical protein